MDAAQVGSEIIAGQRKIVDVFDFGAELVLVTAPAEGDGLSARHVQVCTLVAEGHADKWIGYELELARSTVATHLSMALDKLGLTARTDIACVWPALKGEISARLLNVKVDGTILTALLIPREVPTLASLTDAENEVMSHAVRGASNAEIAALRGTSRRTVANQLASIYRKLGLCSRSELAAYVA